MNSIFIIFSILSFSSIAFGEKQWKPVLNLLAQPEHRPEHAKVVLDAKKTRKDSPVLNLIVQPDQRPMHASDLESNATNATEASAVNVTLVPVAANSTLPHNGTIPPDHSNSTVDNSSIIDDHANSSIGDHANLTTTGHFTPTPTVASYKASPIPSFEHLDQKAEQSFLLHSKSDKNDSATTLFVVKGKYVKTSAFQKSCKQNQDCYHLREPDEWCPLPDRAKYGDKGCFCDHQRNLCAIQRQTEKGDEFSDCAEKSTSVCASLKPVLRIQHGKSKKKRLRAKVH